MAKNIDFMGAVYSDVPSVRLPQQGGGLVGFDDTTDATATAEDIAQGKTAYVNGQKVTGTGTGSTPVINPLSVTENGTYTAPSGVDGYSPVTVNVSGGGGGSVEESDVNFYDYDGTCVASYSAADFANLTAMPANPSHTGLTAQGWNWTLADAKTYVAKYGMLDIGQMYITDDGKTRIYITLPEDRLTPYVAFGLNGTAEIDWGDGSEHTVFTGPGLSTRTYKSHTYAIEGDYVITITITGTAKISGEQAGTFLIGDTNSSILSTGSIYRAAIKKIEIGSNVNLDAYAFSRCFGIESITIPKNTSGYTGSYIFYQCYALKCIVFPTGFGSVGPYAVYQCRNIEVISLPYDFGDFGRDGMSGLHLLKRCTLPPSVGTVTRTMFDADTNLAHVIIPDGVTSIDTSAFSSCYCLTKIIVPSSVTSIGNSAFGSCGGVKEYHFQSTTPPTLGGTSVFSNIASDCKIYVPYSADHSILAAYQTATNWSAQASKMVEEEP